MAELEFCARANNMLILDVMCWPAPIDPRYRCRQPNPSAYPVLENSSFEFLNLFLLNLIINCTLKIYKIIFKSFSAFIFKLTHFYNKFLSKILTKCSNIF